MNWLTWKDFAVPWPKGNSESVDGFPIKAVGHDQIFRHPRKL
jgi:hypothetical protein